MEHSNQTWYNQIKLDMAIYDYNSPLEFLLRAKHKNILKSLISKSFYKVNKEVDNHN